MMTLEKNIIKKEIIDLQYNGTINEFELQQSADRLKEKINNGIDAVLSKYSKDDEVLIIDMLSIDVTDIELTGWEQDVTEKIMLALERALQRELQQNAGSKGPISGKQHQEQSLLFYLQHGYLPWNIKEKPEELVLAFVSGVTEQFSGNIDIKQLRKVLYNEAAIGRLVSLLPDNVYWQLLQVLHNSASEMTAVWRHDYEVLRDFRTSSPGAPFSSNAYKRALLHIVIIENNWKLIEKRFATTISGHVLEFISNSHNESVIEKIKNPLLFDLLKGGAPQKTSRSDGSEEVAKAIEQIPKLSDQEFIANAESSISKLSRGEHEIFISNSGIVIIAPYLPAFFKELGIVQGNEIVDITRAVSLMHNIVAGSEQAVEYEIPLFKLIAGMNIEAHIDLQYEFTDTDRTQIEILLNAVIRNWNILKNTSIDGLRTAFLQREGKLVIDGDRYKLVVQRESYDVLLQHLPWNISMVKLPWMQQLLTVEWL